MSTSTASLPCAPSPDPDRHDSAGRALERIAGLAPDEQPEQVAAPWPVTAKRCAWRSRPRRSERRVANVLQPAPTRACSSTSFPVRGTWPPRRRPAKRTVPPGRTHARRRAAAGHGPACGRSPCRARAGAGRRRRTPSAACATGRRGAGPRRGPRASVRSTHAAAAAITTVRLAQTSRQRGRPRRRCASVTARAPSGSPPAVSRARRSLPARLTDSDVTRRSGRVERRRSAVDAAACRPPRCPRRP